MPVISSRFPVGGIPMSSPVCVPVPVTRATTRSPSAIRSWMTWMPSGCAVVKSMNACLIPSSPGLRPGIGGGSWSIRSTEKNSALCSAKKPLALACCLLTNKQGSGNKVRIGLFVKTQGRRGSSEFPESQHLSEDELARLEEDSHS